jgi:hypothetical protein
MAEKLILITLLVLHLHQYFFFWRQKVVRRLNMVSWLLNVEKTDIVDLRVELSVLLVLLGEILSSEVMTRVGDAVVFLWVLGVVLVWERFFVVLL